MKKLILSLSLTVLASHSGAAYSYGNDKPKFGKYKCSLETVQEWLPETKQFVKSGLSKFEFMQDAETRFENKGFALRTKTKGQPRKYFIFSKNTNVTSDEFYVYYRDGIQFDSVRVSNDGESVVMNFIGDEYPGVKHHKFTYSCSRGR